MSARNFIIMVGDDMRRTATQMDKFIVALENDFIDTVAQVKDLSDDQFKQMGFPIGLINEIRKKLNAPAAAGGQAQVASNNPVLKMIDTTGAA